VRRYVLDANALLGYLGRRPGSQRVHRLIREAERSNQQVYMSSVNWGEVVYALWKAEGPATAKKFINEVISSSLAILPVDRERAAAAAELKALHGLGYADSFAAALAMELRATFTTADPEFQKVGQKLKLDLLPRHEHSSNK
jgi:predicted nucleic acid-binding protein